MARAAHATKTETMLEQKLRGLTGLAQARMPDARVEMSCDRQEDEDAHLRIYPPADLSPDEVQEIELTLGHSNVRIIPNLSTFAWRRTLPSRPSRDRPGCRRLRGGP